MIKLQGFHESPATLHVNCEEPRSYFVPAETKEKAKDDNRAASAYFKSLCGDWDFNSTAPRLTCRTSPRRISRWTTPTSSPFP